MEDLSSQLIYDYKEKCDKNEIYFVEGTKNTWRMFTHSGIATAAAAESGNWAYQDTTQYWQQVVVPNNIFKSKVYKCLQVGWFNPNWTTEKITPGFYHVYLRHGGTFNARIEVHFTVTFASGYKHETQKFMPYANEFPAIQSGEVFNTYFATLNLLEIGSQPVTVNIQLFTNGGTYDYLLEGIIFVPASSLEKQVPFFFVLEQDKHLNLDSQRMTNSFVLEIESEKKTIKQWFNSTKLKLKGIVTAENNGTTHEGPENLIQDESKWCVSRDYQSDIFLELEQEIQFSQFGLKSANDCPERDPQIAEVFIQNAQEDWISVLKCENIEFEERFQVKNFKIPGGRKNAKKIKVYLEASSDTNEIQLAEIILYN